MTAVVYALAPALPLHKAGPFVAAAYIVFVLIILVYVAIMGLRLARNQRELVELRQELERREADGDLREFPPGSRPAGQLPGSDGVRDAPADRVTDLTGQL